MNGRYDFLFKVDRGLVALYNPRVHGVWEIRIGPNGKPKTSMAGNDGLVDDGQLISSPHEDQDDEAPSEGTDFLFPLERHLRDFLAANISSVAVRSSSLTLYTDESGQSGVEYPTGVGPIDLLAVDAAGRSGLQKELAHLAQGGEVAPGLLLGYPRPGGQGRGAGPGDAFGQGQTLLGRRRYHGGVGRLRSACSNWQRTPGADMGDGS